MEIEPFTDSKLEALAAAVFDLGYGVMDAWIAPAECQTLRAELIAIHAEGKLKQAGIGRGEGFQRNATIRGDEILWIDEAAPQLAAQLFLGHLQAIISFFNRVGYAGIRDYEAHFAAYPLGTFYKRHRDQFKDKGSRRFTFIFYLNPNWMVGDGGELRMYVPVNGQETIVDITPISGRLVCFRSEMFDHEVLLTHKMRYSITGWWLDKEKSLAFLG